MKQNRKEKKARISTARGDTARMMRQIDTASSQQRVFRRRMAGTPISVSTGAGGTILLTTLATTANISATCPDFSSCASLYVAYRCLALEIVVLPFFPVNTTAVTVPPMVAVAPFQTGTGGTTFAGLCDGSRSQLCSGYKGYKFAASKQGDPEANLWTQVTSAIPAVESYGFQAISDATVATANNPVWRVQMWYLVEFRTAQ